MSRNIFKGLNKKQIHALNVTTSVSLQMALEGTEERLKQFKSTLMLTPRDLWEELIVKEIELSREKILNTDPIFQKYINSYLEDLIKNDLKLSPQMLRYIIPQFAINESLEEYYNFDKKTINNWEAEGDIKLPYLFKLIDVLISLLYHKELLKVYDRLQQGNKTLTYTGLKSNLDFNQLKKLFKKLSGEYISTKSDLNSFIEFFSGKTVKGKIIWIKKSSKNKLINKLALVDLLELSGIPKSTDDFKSKITNTFVDEMQKPITMYASNLDNSKSNPHSEFYIELQNIINSL